MRTLAFMAGAALMISFAPLPAGEPGPATEGAEFRSKPTAKADGANVRIEFEADETTDVAVEILDAEGKVVRHQPIDGLPWDGRNIDGIRAITSSPDGTIYVLGGWWHPHLDRQGNFLREVYPPPAFACDPVAMLVMCTNPKLNWRLLLIGGKRQGDDKAEMPSYVYDREAGRWVALNVAGLGQLGGSDGLSVFDPEHNVVLGLRGGACRYKNVPIGTRAFYAGPLGTP